MSDLNKFFIRENLKYLRNRLGIDISTLSEITDVDPIDIATMEGEVFESDGFTNDSPLIKLCNYYAIRLDEMVYDDIEVKGTIKDNFIEQLKNEFENGIRADRTEFNNCFTTHYNNNYLTEQASDIDTAKSILFQLHSLCKIEQKYYNMRRKGRLD